MRGLVRSTIFLAGLCVIALAPVKGAVITATTDALALAQKLVGPGVTIISATLTGGPNQAGTFTAGGNAATGVGFDDGIVLSSGDVTKIPGANVSNPETFEANNTGSNTLSTEVGTPGDTQLTVIAGAPTYDASILTITFSIANPGDLFFNFVFGSEEYIDYVTPIGFRGFNDVFGFFVDGTNIALVGGQPITVNTINPVVNASSYRNNVPNINGFPNLGLNIKFDGLTTVLQAHQAGLAAGQHTIKFAVADTLDQKLDAGVFLQAGSLATTGPVSIAKAFNPTSVSVNGTSTLTITLTNPNLSAFPNADLTALSFTDPLPAGIVVAATPALTNTCNGTPVAVAGSSSISLTGGTLAANAAGNATCVITVSVLANGAVLGQISNVTSGVTSTPGGVGMPSNPAILNVGPPPVPPTIQKIFGTSPIQVGGSTSLTFTISNPNAGVALSGLGFVDALPAGLLISTPNGLNGTCGGGTITALAGTGTITLVGATLGGGTNCTFSVNVTGTAAGTFTNVTTTLTSSNAPGGVPATQPITVLGPPFLSKSFGVLTMLLNGTTSLNFVVTNPNLTTGATGIGFTDALPAGLVVATPNGLTGSCGGGTITAVAGSTNVILAGAMLAANTSCNFSVDVTGVALGNLTNVTSPVTSANAGLGNAATAGINILDPNDPDSVFQVRYASNLNIGDSVIDITNNGRSSTTGIPIQNGNLCVNVYTFSPDEQLISCCSCFVTPNGLASLSVQNDLISRTLTPGVPTSVVIKLVGTAGGATASTCNASTVGTGTNQPALGMVAFGTTLHAAPVTPGSPAGTYGLTETRFTHATLSTAEIARLTSLCGFNQINGSGFGICKACRIGGLGAANQ